MGWNIEQRRHSTRTQVPRRILMVRRADMEGYWTRPQNKPAPHHRTPPLEQLRPILGILAIVRREGDGLACSIHTVSWLWTARRRASLTKWPAGISSVYYSSIAARGKGRGLGKMGGNVGEGSGRVARAPCPSFSWRLHGNTREEAGHRGGVMILFVQSHG